MSAATSTGGAIPVVGPREPCPCGSGRRYKACHGRAGSVTTTLRPFAGLPSEVEWVALREVVPAATAPLALNGRAEGRQATLATVLPMAWPAMVRSDGRVFLGLQVAGRSGDPSRDLAAALLAALDLPPGSPITSVRPAPDGPRLQDLLGPDPLDVTVTGSFDFWIEGVADTDEGEVATSLQKANAAVVPTERLAGVEAAYWCEIHGRRHLRWVLPHDEDPLLDALARLAADRALGLGPDDRFVGTFRAHGLLVPVWDLAPDRTAAELEEPVAALDRAIRERLGDASPLTADERRSRAGLIGRQVTLR